MEVTGVVLGVTPRQEQALEMWEAGWVEVQARVGGFQVVSLSSSAPQSWVAGEVALEDF